jgi:hypothetical protein
VVFGPPSVAAVPVSQAVRAAVSRRGVRAAVRGLFKLAVQAAVSRGPLSVTVRAAVSGRFKLAVRAAVSRGPPSVTVRATAGPSVAGRCQLQYHQRPKVEDVEALAESEFAAIPDASLPACSKISKAFVSYLSGLVAVSPYRRGTADPRVCYAAGSTAGGASAWASDPSQTDKKASLVMGCNLCKIEGMNLLGDHILASPDSIHLRQDSLRPLP